MIVKKFDINLLGYMNQFKKVTKVNLKDTFTINDTIIFVTNPGKAGIAVDEGNYIIVDSKQRTNIPGVYAAGDVTNLEVKQIVTAASQGIVAATEAFGYIKRPYYYRG